MSELYNGKTWKEWDDTEYECPQNGCGRETSHVEEGYFQCRCGWFGEPISKIEDLEEEVKRLTSKLETAQQLIEDCGYCGECYWDKESIYDEFLNLKEPKWPSGNTPLCEECMVLFKEMFE